MQPDLSNRAVTALLKHALLTGSINRKLGGAYVLAAVSLVAIIIGGVKWI